jgi:hypothetical protein
LPKYHKKRRKSLNLLYSKKAFNKFSERGANQVLKKSLYFLLIVSIVFISSNFVLAQSKNDWAAVENSVNQEAAVKTGGGTTYGIIKSVNADSLVLQIAGSKSMTQEEKTVSRNDIRQIRRALLFVNDRNTAKGALIGAGVGAVALGVPAVASGKGDDEVNDGLAGAAFFLGAIGGAAVGGVAGFFTKKKHKKRDLIFQR